MAKKEKKRATLLDVITRAVAQQHNAGIEQVENDIKEKKEKYGIGYKEYFDKDLFAMSDADFQAMIDQEKEWYASSIAKLKAEDRAKSLSTMEHICKEYDIPYRIYYEKKYYNLHEYSILNQITVQSEEYQARRMDIAAGMLNKPKAEIEARMAYVKNKFGINPTEFFLNDYCFFSDAEIKKEQEMVDYSYLISQVSKQSYDEAKTRADEVEGKFGISNKLYKNRLYYTMTDREIAEDIEQRKDELLASIRKEAGKIGKTPREIMFDSKIDSLKYGTTLSDYLLFKMYDKTDEERKTWINYDKDVRNIKRKYRLKETDLLENKVKFYKAFPKEIGRKWWSNIENNTFEDFAAFAEGLDEVIIKPMAGRMGQGVRKQKIDNDDLEPLYRELIDSEVTIVEECIKQHDDMSAFYPDCVHCCRIVTILKDGKCFFPQTSIKFGIDAVSDNLATGGLCANVDTDTGVICTDGATKKGEILEFHPYSNKRIKGFKVPYWKEILELAEKVIREIEDINLIAFDIAITNDGPVIVEGNDTPDFRVFEYPLIGQRTGLRYKLEPFITTYQCKW